MEVWSDSITIYNSTHCSRPSSGIRIPRPGGRQVGTIRFEVPSSAPQIWPRKNWRIFAADAFFFAMQKKIAHRRRECLFFFLELRVEKNRNCAKLFWMMTKPFKRIPSKRVTITLHKRRFKKKGGGLYLPGFLNDFWYIQIYLGVVTTLTLSCDLLRRVVGKTHHPEGSFISFADHQSTAFAVMTAIWVTGSTLDSMKVSKAPYFEFRDHYFPIPLQWCLALPPNLELVEISKKLGFRVPNTSKHKVSGGFWKTRVTITPTSLIDKKTCKSYLLMLLKIQILGNWQFRIPSVQTPFP